MTPSDPVTTIPTGTAAPSPDTISLWKGALGDAYHERNIVAPGAATPFFTRALKNLTIGSALEVGAGRGGNLLAIRDAYPDAVLLGIEPNESARQAATEDGLLVQDGDARVLNIRAGYQLVLTAGLLIHIPPAVILDVMGRLIDASRNYVMFIEYQADHQQEVPYQGHRDILWKRPYRAIYESLGLTWVRGDTADPELFPGATWAILQKLPWWKR